MSKEEALKAAEDLQKFCIEQQHCDTCPFGEKSKITSSVWCILEWAPPEWGLEKVKL